MFRKSLNIDACPTTKDLRAYAAKQLIGKRNEEIFHHLKFCGKCLRAMADLTRVPSASEIIQGSPRPGFLKRLLARVFPGRR